MFPLELAVRLIPRMATTSLGRLTSQASSSGVVINVNYKSAIAGRSFHSSPIRLGPKKSKLNIWGTIFSWRGLTVLMLPVLVVNGILFYREERKKIQYENRMNSRE